MQTYLVGSVIYLLGLLSLVFPYFPWPTLHMPFEGLPFEELVMHECFPHLWKRRFRFLWWTPIYHPRRSCVSLRRPWGWQLLSPKCGALGLPIPCAINGEISDILKCVLKTLLIIAVRKRVCLRFFRVPGKLPCFFVVLFVFLPFIHNHAWWEHWGLPYHHYIIRPMTRLCIHPSLHHVCPPLFLYMLVLTLFESIHLHNTSSSCSTNMDSLHLRSMLEGYAL